MFNIVGPARDGSATPSIPPEARVPAEFAGRGLAPGSGALERLIAVPLLSRSA